MPAKIAIVVPSHDYSPVTFASDLATMAIYSRAALDPEIELGVAVITGTYIHSARRKMLQTCIEAKCTHILWLDSDMRFPPDTLVRLLNHQKSVVGINYANRQFPTGFVAFERLNENESVRLKTLADSTGLVTVDALGFGVLLMALNDVVPVLPPLEEDPWFTYDWKPDQNEVGEDVHFCFLLKKKGIDIYVDQDLSKICGHTGSMVYTTAMVPISQKVVEDEKAERARKDITVA